MLDGRIGTTSSNSQNGSEEESQDQYGSECLVGGMVDAYGSEPYAREGVRVRLSHEAQYEELRW